MPAQPLDSADARILRVIQEDATLSIAAVAQKVNMSQNACWRRIKKLEQTGVIAKRVTLLNAEALGLSMTVFVSLRVSEHSEEWLSSLASTVSQIPQVVEFYRMSGDVDYLLKLKVSSIDEYDSVYKKLIRTVKLGDVTSAFAMEEMHYTTSLAVNPTKFADS